MTYNKNTHQLVAPIPMLQSFTKIMRLTTNFTGKVAFLMFSEAEKQLRNKNHIEDWALGCYPRDNG